MDRRMNTRLHVVFVDDDETELATFRRLYEGDRFQVTTVCAQFPRSALPAIEQALGQEVPDLFLLDALSDDDGSAGGIH
jgi:CheY-like chemotaxis protein